MLEQTVYATPLVRLGRFEAKPDDPLFSAITPPGHYLLAFPQTALTIVYERAGEFVVDPTTVTFYHPDEIYQRRAISAHGDRCNWLSMRTDLLDEVLADAGIIGPASTPKFAVPVAHCPSKLFAAQRELFASARCKADPLAIEDRTIALLRSLIAALGHGHRVSVAACSAATRRGVVRAQEFLADRFRQSSSVAEIACHANLSAFHLCRAFRAQTGVSLHRYRTALRLYHGYDALAESGRLTDLALSLGFSSHSHFSHTFKALFGHTPRSIARRCRAESAGAQHT